ncbi:MAG: lysostaphin resistance A-like protein [Sumerlaeia bacterium]
MSFTFNFESMQSVRSMLFGSMIIWILGLLSGIIFWNQQLDVVQPISARILVPSIGGGLVLFGFSMILNVVWPGAEDLTTNQTLESVSFSVPALVAMLFIVLNAAIAEELIFRLGIQKLLQDWFGPFAAVLLTSLIFMFGHVGMVEPLGFKETQIFLVSVGFCLLRLRYGIYSSLIAHAFFNSAAIIVQIFLVLYQSQGS